MNTVPMQVSEPIRPIIRSRTCSPDVPSTPKWVTCVEAPNSRSDLRIVTSLLFPVVPEGTGLRPLCRCPSTARTQSARPGGTEMTLDES